MKIGIAYDLAPVEALSHEGPDDHYEEFDKPETVDAIADVIRSEGHEVVLLGDGREFLRKVLVDPPDFVFNIAEGQGVGRSREARVPAVLEMLGIPHSGSDPLTMAATLDKSVAKDIVGASGVVTPKGGAIPADSSDEVARSFIEYHLTTSDYPTLLKPAFEGSSKGIRARCLAENPKEALSIFRELSRDYDQPILIEEFIEGDEITVGLVGNGREVEILGVMRILPTEPTDRFVYSLEVKRDWRRRVRYEAPAALSRSTLHMIKTRARLAYEALGCRDVARIDFRLRARDGHPIFLEANPLPGLSPESSDLVILARGHGIEYDDLVRRLLHAALIRNGLM